MSDSFWFFPKQQNVGNAPPPSPIPSTGEQTSEKSLDDALFDLEKEMPAVVPVATPLPTPSQQTAPVQTFHPPQPSSHPRLELLKHTIEDIKKNSQKALDLLNEELGSGVSASSSHNTEHLSQLVPGMAVDTARHMFHTSTPITSVPTMDGATHEGNVVEGIFDGQGMVGPDGKQYSIPPNYASKSKLVEGDILKLTISYNGSFIYKQIAPVARRRVIGILETDMETHMFVVRGEGQVWRVLTASVTYFKGVGGDEVVILVPRDKPSKWAAVENIIKKF